MKIEVAAGIEQLKRQFSTTSLTLREDGQGGAYVVMEPVAIGQNYKPTATWIGFHITAQYPYADIYPVFIGADVVRTDGVAFAPPVTSGHHFEGRPALQISRRNTAAQSCLQTVPAKILKILDFLGKLTP
jgi:hypothetical protein